MRSGELDTPADLLVLTPELCSTRLDWIWCGIRTKESADVPAASGLRNPAQVGIRAWWDERLIQGCYLATADRLFHIDSVRDFSGNRLEVAITATELIGRLCEYRPAGLPGKPCRVHLTHSAPYLDELGQVTDYKTRAEVALIEVGRPQVDDQLQVGTDLYIVIGYASDSDDGVVRGLWLDRVA